MEQLKLGPLSCWLACGVLLASAQGWAQAKTRAELLLEADAAPPGETVMAAVRLQMAKGWHTYWRNPGESGKATEISWQLPDGVSADEILWPPPEVHSASGMTTYVYHNEVFLLVPLRLDPALKPGTPLELAAEVDWLECEVACVPGRAQVRARLEVAADRRPSTHAETIAAWRSRVPQPLPGLEVRAWWEKTAVGEQASLNIEGNLVGDFSPTDFLAYEADAFEVKPGAKVVPKTDGRFHLIKEVTLFGKSQPERILGILVKNYPADGPIRAVEVILSPAYEGARNGSYVSDNNSGFTSFSASKTAIHGSLLAMLGLAFLGGMILNVMPCVLPVVALKVLGFVQQSGEKPGYARRLGLIYALGILVSFWGLVIAVLLVRGAGGEAGWGMQMQNPVFRVVLLTVVTLVALNLFGVFEVLLPGVATETASFLASQQGPAGAFFHGVLATALATPCTAPFLAVALGFAFTQPAWFLWLSFTAVALGLAFPYVALSWNPAWLRFLPKPGPWMVRLKVFMGFPMLATAIWLLDFSAPTYGEGGILWLGLYLVVLSLAAWIWGEFGQRGGSRRQWPAAAVGLVLVAAGYFFILERRLQWRTAQITEESSESSQAQHIAARRDILWLPWDPDLVEKARLAGRPVLVDFTARWCLTCQANKRFALDVPEVKQRLKELNVLTLRADNTNPNPLINAELKRYGRAGVPLVVLFPPQPTAPPIVLPELLTPTTVLDALNRMGN